ncbi:MAG TPA: hypothetical protein VK968_11055, partial [Roseimicrobium sp.]|nr:hypothetical protein [Roseimicrobium sp.]
GNVTNDFKLLLEHGYLATQGPDTLLGRLVTDNTKKRMPKGKNAKPWTPAEVADVKLFLTELNKYVKVDGQADELFPAALTTAFNGEVSESLDNQFITYTQLKGKIKTVFGDDWNRNGADRFQQNVAMFGGADFKERFNESSKASSSFLTGVEMLSRDVASRAYTRKTGPFAGRPDSFNDPSKLGKPDSAYEKEIKRLYEAILFRGPSSKELEESFSLIKGVYAARDQIQGTDVEIGFKLTVTDDSTKLESSRIISIPVSGDRHGIYQEWVDQSKATGDAKEKVMRQKLAKKFNFKSGDDGQLVRVHNVDSIGNVSLHGIEIQKGGGPVKQILVTDSSVQADGAWKINTRDGITSYEDDNFDKGNSSVTIPVKATEAGSYDVTLLWRKNPSNAGGVLVEVFSTEGEILAKPALAKAPSRGEAQFYYDASADNVAFYDVGAQFQFGGLDAVEINNKGTRSQVTVSAINFVQADGKGGFLVDAKEAEGVDKWQSFDSGTFRAFNIKGTPYTDGGKSKGDLSLRFKPSAKKDTWKAGTFYRVQVNYPAKAGNEVRSPVVVRAQKSSPIIQVAYPSRARGDAPVEMDASTSYTVQGSKLKFNWQQIEGPAVKLDVKGGIVKFTAPRRSLQQSAWEALARALVRHPDFLFTRAPSIQTVKGKADKQHLQLAKAAQDLVGRAPTRDEFSRLDKGVPYTQIIDEYLKSQEFKDFYFHRIRLYLESQGTESQDEPARIWSYIAFNDRPFQEILTADYTVDKNFQKQPRPAYHGKTGVLTAKGFIEGKPGLPHFNYAAQVAMLFLGYVFEVPPEIVQMREGLTAASTVDPTSVCFSCHKILTPIAVQRNMWDDEGKFRRYDELGLPIDASDANMVDGYPFPGEGLEAFATQAVKKERFVRTIINTHFTFYFGREMRFRDDERFLYKKVWDDVHADGFKLRTLVRSLVTSPEYMEGKAQVGAPTQQVSLPKLRASNETSTR